MRHDAIGRDHVVAPCRCARTGASSSASWQARRHPAGRGCRRNLVVELCFAGFPDGPATDYLGEAKRGFAVSLQSAEGIVAMAPTTELDEPGKSGQGAD